MRTGDGAEGLGETHCYAGKGVDGGEAVGGGAVVEDGEEGGALGDVFGDFGSRLDFGLGVADDD